MFTGKICPTNKLLMKAMFWPSIDGQLKSDFREHVIFCRKGQLKIMNSVSFTNVRLGQCDTSYKVTFDHGQKKLYLSMYINSKNFK